MLTQSPWLNFERTELPSLKSDHHCEVAIVGAGISGVATLYYILTSTDKDVVLVEKNKVASGATGHNAGLAIAAMEKPASELGKELAQTIYHELDEAWDDLHAIHAKIGFEDNLLPFSHFANGFHSLSRFISFVKDLHLRGGQTNWRYLVLESLKPEIPEELSTIVEYHSQQTLRKELQTIDDSYIAIALRTSPFKANRMNSALFCYRVLEYLKEKFPQRFFVYEQTDISKIDLHANHSVLKHAHGSITAQEVILCTNAYTDFSIWDQVHQKPFTKLQDSIQPRLGYLAAFPNASPKSFAFGLETQQAAVPFWYFSQAPSAKHNPLHSFVIGGPEFDADDLTSTEWIDEKGKESLTLIQDFLKTTLKEPPTTFSFFWYGWMGYTPTGLRWVGRDVDHPHLWYNLGCNGVGIVQAVGGAKKIAAQLK